MKRLSGVWSAIALLLVLLPSAAPAASAKCVVVKKEGSVLVMDCGDRGDTIPKGANVKVKTDRDQQVRQSD